MKKLLVITLFFGLLLSSCDAAATIQPTLISVNTALPASTFTPEPTNTPQPTNSPTPLPTLQILSPLQSLTLPEFDARYSAGDIALSEDGRFMAVVSKDKLNGNYSIWVWNLNDLNRSVASYLFIMDTLWSVAFNPVGNNLAVGSSGEITILDWKAGSILKVIDLPELPNYEVAQLVFGQDDILVFSTFGNKVFVWDLSRNQVKYSVDGLTGFKPTSFSISPDNQMLATGMYESINLWDFETGRSLSAYEGVDGGIGIAPAIAFSSKGTYLASTGCNEFAFEGCSRAKLLIWKSGSNTPMVISNVHPSWINTLAFSPNEELLASAGGSASIKLIRLADKKIMTAPVLEKPGQMPPNDPLDTNDMVFLPDGKILAVSTNDGIQFLDVAKMSWMPNLRFILQVGYSYMITKEGDNLNLRMEASLKGQVIRVLRAGQWFTVIDGPTIADSFIWWKIKSGDNTEGWVVEMPNWYANPP